MNKILLIIFITSLLSPGVAQPQERQEVDRTEYQRRTYMTAPVQSHQESPKIDGLIDDPAWDNVEWAGDFTVYTPNNGDLPQRESKFKMLYDLKNLYIAFRCYHEDPTKIESRLGRRDNFPGDWMEINIDSYFDKNTAFSFNISASGVKGDEFVSGNGNSWDSNWNPVWFAKTNIDAEGWTGEIRIPLSQIRFGPRKEHVWGINVLRRDFGADERSAWQWVPQNRNGWVSNFGEIHGIKGIKPTRQLEIQPFTVGSLHTSERNEDDPFADGTETNLNFGLDGKFALTSDLTLDFTVNPDFGQVEADPSALTLDGFQIFFGERRPFFIENANLFSFRIARLDAGGPFGNDNLFYSRRIGARPSAYLDLPAGAHVDVPKFTSILGAAKVSGKTKEGWSISLLESVTAEEIAEVDINGERQSLVVEPLTNYFVAGLGKDFRNGETTLSGKLTGVHRKLDGTGLHNQYHSEAITGGIELFHAWKSREWQLRANYVFSNVEGTPQKIFNTQTGFEHYFQRPDAGHLFVDESLTSLAGSGGTISLGNYGGSDNLSYQSGITWRSPGLELNDIGFLATADQVDHVSWMGYRAPKPFSVFRSFRLNLNHYQRWTTGGDYLYNAANTNFHFSFKNYWGLGSGVTLEFRDYSTKALFGGPLLKRSPGFYTWMYLESDNRKKLVAGANISGGHSIGKDRGAVDGRGGDIWLNYQPHDRLRLSINPSYNLTNRVIQYVAGANFNGQARYITATVRQETFSVPVRVNYSITPDLTLQYWGQPFISKGNYKDYKYITDPLAKVYTSRFELYDESQLSYDTELAMILVDEDRDGSTDYSFEDPEFNFLQWRSNLVMRWEYKPGSEFFVVWTQSTTNFGDPERNIIPSLGEDLFGMSFNNIFLFKVTYRFVNN